MASKANITSIGGGEGGGGGGVLRPSLLSNFSSQHAPSSSTMDPSLADLYKEAFSHSQHQLINNISSNSNSSDLSADHMEFTQASIKRARDSSPVSSEDNSTPADKQPNNKKALHTQEQLSVPSKESAPQSPKDSQISASDKQDKPPTPPCLYSECNEGPFIVFTEPLSAESLSGKLHPTTVGRVIASHHKGNII